MPKDIYSSRDDLVCGKIDEAERLAIRLESIELLDLLKEIRYDCERMEAGLIRYKDGSERLIKSMGVSQNDSWKLAEFCVKNMDVIPKDIGISDELLQRINEFRDDYYHGNDYTDYRLHQPKSSNETRTEMFLNSKAKEEVCSCKECGRKYYKIA